MQVSFAKAAAVLLLVAAIRGQKLDIGPNVRVTEAGAFHVEPHVAAHPREANRLLVSLTHFGRSGSVVETFSTADAGVTWLRSELPRLRQLAAAGQLENATNARAAYTSDGVAYCVLIAILKAHQSVQTRIFLYRTGAHENSWKGPTSVGPLYDRPTLLTSGNAVYVAAMSPGGRGTAVALLRSTDGGATLQRIVSLVPDSLGHQPMQPVLSSAGTLILPFLDFPRHRENLHCSRAYVARSRDGGATFDLPVFVTDIPRASPGSLEMASAGKTVFAAFNGGPQSLKNLTVARSDDDGRTWTSSVISADASIGSLAVAPDGTIGVAWIQHLANKPECWVAYFSASTNDGQTYAAPARISAGSSCPGTEAKTIAAGFRRGDNDYGDYLGLCSASDGSFHLVWPDARDGTLAVYTSRIWVH